MLTKMFGNEKWPGNENLYNLTDLRRGEHESRTSCDPAVYLVSAESYGADEE